MNIINGLKLKFVSHLISNKVPAAHLFSKPASEWFSGNLLKIQKTNKTNIMKSIGNCRWNRLVTCQCHPIFILYRRKKSIIQWQCLCVCVCVPAWSYLFLKRILIGLVQSNDSLLPITEEKEVWLHSFQCHGFSLYQATLVSAWNFKCNNRLKSQYRWFTTLRLMQDSSTF